MARAGAVAYTRLELLDLVGTKTLGIENQVHGIPRGRPAILRDGQPGGR